MAHQEQKKRGMLLHAALLIVFLATIWLPRSWDDRPLRDAWSRQMNARPSIEISRAARARVTSPPIMPQPQPVVLEYTPRVAMRDDPLFPSPNVDDLREHLELAPINEDPPGRPGNNFPTREEPSSLSFPTEEPSSPVAEPSAPKLPEEAPLFPPPKRPILKQQPEPSHIVEPAEVPQVPSVWATPQALQNMLDELVAECESGEWALNVDQRLQELVNAGAENDQRVVDILEELADLAQNGKKLSRQERRLDLRTKIARAEHALSRRLRVWEAAWTLSHLETLEKSDSSDMTAEAGSLHPENLLASVSQVDQRLRSMPQGDAWRTYLRLPDLSRLDQLPQEQASGVARGVLHRLTNVRLSRAQRNVLSEPAFVTLRRSLKPWAGASIDLATFLAKVEEYELQREPSQAYWLAKTQRALSVGEQDNVELARTLERNYRNANFRVAISDKLINRFLPGDTVSDDPVRDMIVGVPVRGRSTTNTDLRVRLQPGKGEWRIALEAVGEVWSSTSAASGPAVLHTRGQTDFLARKCIVVNRGGLHVSPAEVQARSNSRLVDVRTDYDGVPLIGSLVQNIARSRHAENRWQANREVEYKVEGKAARQLDERVSGGIANAEQTFQRAVDRRLQSLKMDWEPIELMTTDQRVIARVRVAGDHQLAAHTPRPQAPADSFASIQVHETLFNNLLARLGLEGQEFTLPQLCNYLSGKLLIRAWKVSSRAASDISFQFAEKDAFRVRFMDGRAEVRMSFARFTKDSKSWKDIGVRIHYRPDLAELRADLERDGSIEIQGDHLSFRDQIALQALFTKILERSRRFAVIQDRIAEDPRMAGLGVTQFHAEDGWMGVAIGPRRDLEEDYLSRSATAQR